jgi:hypothetical protein
MRFWMMLVAAGIGCGETKVRDVNEAPFAQITSHEDGDVVLEGATVSFQGNAVDADHDAGELLATWYAGETQICEAAAPESDGTTTCSDIPISDAFTEVRLEVKDPTNLAAKDTVSLTVQATDAPVAKIVLPDGESPYRVGDIIDFEGSVTDAEDGPGELSLTLSSDIDGELDFGPEVTTDGVVRGSLTLTEGTHTLLFTAEDTLAKTGSDSVIVQVNPANTAPLCAISAPADGSASELGVLVTFEGEVSDIDQAANTLGVVWESDFDGELGTSTPDSDGSVRLSTGSLSVNTHQITLVVTDDLGEVCTTSLTTTVGQAPTVNIVRPTDGDAFGADTVITFEGTVGDSEDLATELSISWDSDLDGVLSTAAADSAGTTQFTLNTTDDAMSPGSHTLTLTVTDTDGLSVSDLVTFVVTENHVPEVSAVGITPDPATPSDTLNCEYTFTDGDGDADLSTLSWTIGGTEVGTGSTLSGAFAPGDTVTCTVTPYDGTDLGIPVSDSVSIDNTAPSIVAVIISPDPAYADDTLECSWIGYADAEGDPDLSMPDWYVDGAFVSSGSTLSGVFAKDQLITCSVVPYDGFSSGTGMSTSMTISNKPPEIVSLSISPTAPMTTDELTVVVSTDDVDGDPLTLSYTWWVDGADSGLGSVDSVPDSATSRDQSWSVTVWPNDGTEDGLSMSSAPVTIGNTAPTTPVIAISPSAPVTETDDLVCEVLTASYDADGDPISMGFTWTLDGVAWVGAAATSTLPGDTIPASETGYEQTWMCIATPSDGSLDGTSAVDIVTTSCEVLTWYRDTDGDGYGDDLDTVEQCEEPSGYVSLGGDCVPDDATLVECPSDGDSDWSDVLGNDPVAWAAVGMDTANDRILVYGGQTYHALSGSTYAYDLVAETWEEATISGADPGTRKGHASTMATGDEYSELVVFGGEDYHTLTAEVFVLDAYGLGAETWNDLTTSEGPEPRVGASMVYDPEAEVALVWGGRGYYGLLSDLWQLDFSGAEAAWTELAAWGDVPERAFSTAVYDPGFDVVYAFGGQTYHALAETPLCLNLDTQEWTELTVSGDEIDALTDASAVYSADYRAVVLYGGQGYHSLPDQAYYIEPVGECEVEVTALAPGEGSSPGGLMGHGMVWDSDEDVALIVGGQGYYRLSESIYSLTP